MLSPLQTPPLRQLRRSSPIPARCAQHVAVRKRILQNTGFSRQNKRRSFSMMPLCGRPEQYSCTREVGLEAAGRKRTAFVLPPYFLKSFFATLNLDL